MNEDDDYSSMLEERNDVYELAADTIKNRIGNDNQEDLKLLQSIHHDEVIVVSGAADKIGSVFEAINLPHKVITPEQLNDINLSPSTTLYMNCHPPGYQASAKKNVKNFVAQGGQLITTDYVLNTLLQDIFPEFVRYEGASTEDRSVKIECAQDNDDEVLKAFKGESTWKLAGGSHPITVVDKEKVTVLISSNELGALFKGLSAVLIKFQYEQGTVYHMISHLQLQNGGTKGNNNNDVPLGSVYARSKGASDEVVEKMEKMEIENKGYDYESVQSATVTTEWVYRSVMNQKKKGNK